MRLLIVLAALGALGAAAAPSASSEAGEADEMATRLAAPAAAAGAMLDGLLRERLRKVSTRVAALRAAQAAEAEAEVEAEQAPAARGAALTAWRGVWDDLKALATIVVDLLRLLLDPAPFGDFYYHWRNNSLLTGNLTLLALNARHLRDLNVKAWHPDILRACLGVELALPEVALDAFYDVDVTVNLETDANGDTFRIYGKGPTSVYMSNIALSTDICLSFKKFDLEVKNMKFSVEMDNVDIQYLFGEEKVATLISGIATDIIPAVIQDFQKELTEWVMRLINKYIQGRLPALEDK